MTDAWANVCHSLTSQGATSLGCEGSTLRVDADGLTDCHNTANYTGKKSYLQMNTFVSAFFVWQHEISQTVSSSVFRWTR